MQSSINTYLSIDTLNCKVLLVLLVLLVSIAYRKPTNLDKGICFKKSSLRIGLIKKKR